MKPGNHADAVRAEVIAVLDRRLDAMRAKDIDRAMSVYSPDIVYFDIIPPHRFVGADAVRRNFLRWFAEYQGDLDRMPPADRWSVVDHPRTHLVSHQSR
jgi:ketosteroid isomerase-like protein